MRLTVSVVSVPRSSPTRNVNEFTPGFRLRTNDQRPTESAVVCSSNHNGTSRVMSDPGAARPRTITTSSNVVLPFSGSTISRPDSGTTGPSVPPGVGVGGGVGVGVGLGVGVGEGVGVGMGVGVGLGDDVGVGVGGVVRLAVGDGLGVGDAVSVGPSGENVGRAATSVSVAVGLAVRSGSTTGEGEKAPETISRTRRPSPPIATKAIQSR